MSTENRSTEHRGTERVSAERATVQAWRDWVRGRPWDHVAVLTFTDLVTVDHAVHEVQRWLRLVSQRSARRGMQWLWVMEQVGPGAPHLHGLTYGTAGLAVKDLMEAWRCGYTQCGGMTPREAERPTSSRPSAGEGVVWDLSAPPRQRRTTSGRRWSPTLARDHPSKAGDGRGDLAKGWANY